MATETLMEDKAEGWDTVQANVMPRDYEITFYVTVRPFDKPYSTAVASVTRAFGFAAESAEQPARVAAEFLARFGSTPRDMYERVQDNV